MYYVNPSSYYGVSIALPLLATLTVAARFVARGGSKRGYGADDWMSLPALFFTWAFAAGLIYGTGRGVYGTHSTPEEAMHGSDRVTLQSKIDYVIVPFSIIALGCIRLVMLFLYRRLFTSRLIHGLIWLLVGFVTVWTLSFSIGLYAECGSHPEASWLTQAETKVFCDDGSSFGLALSVSDVILDLLIILLPLFPIWGLQMKTAKKLATLLIFLGGIFATGCGIVRAVLYHKIYAHQLNLDGSVLPGIYAYDIIGVIGTVHFWAMIEVGVACIACNLTALPGLFKGAVGEAVRSVEQWISMSSLPRSSGSRRRAMRRGTVTGTIDINAPPRYLPSSDSEMVSPISPVDSKRSPIGKYKGDELDDEDWERQYHAVV